MKYVIYGVGSSGLSAIKFLAEKKQEIIVTDDNVEVLSKVVKLFEGNKNIIFADCEEINFDKNTIIIFAPGIPLYYPKPHKILEIVKKSGAKLSCDIEEFYKRNSDNDFIAITGTNGKSTTTALTGFIFNELGIDSEIGGNFVVPCLELNTINHKTSGKSFLLETSSYQLDLINETHFHIAALLNITPDHIDRHGSIEGYIAAKKRVFKNQTEGDFTLIDVDNVNSKKIFDELKKDINFKSTLIPISTQRVSENGVSIIDDVLINNIEGNASKMNAASEFLPGEHNSQNIAFAFAITYCQLLHRNKSINELEIIEAIKKFTGLRHRMQIVGKIDNVRFINDSKATNADSAKNSLKTYNNIFWILGGVSKDGGIESLTPYFKKIKKAYLIGNSSDEFAKTLKNNSVIFEKCGNLDNALKKALFDAKNISLSEKNILLSPACASFDQWQNFEQRGDYFCKAFNELQKT